VAARRDNRATPSSEALLPPHRRVRLAGLFVLVAGWIAAAIVLVAAARAGDDDAPPAARGETRTLERIGGQAVVRTVAFDRWFASLWQGERLGWTLAVLSLVIGGACFYVGGLMGETVAEGEERGPAHRP
jgi:hypothetical protein